MTRSQGEDMDQNQQIERYLSELEKHLQIFTPSRRAKEITRIREELQEAFQAQPNRPADEIITHFGSPKKVAQEIIATAIPGHQSEATAVVKWLVIGFLGLGALATAIVAIVFFAFSPLVEMDNKTGSIKLFGGRVDLDDFEDSNYTFRYNNRSLEGFSTLKTSQRLDISDRRVEVLEYNFSNGQVEIETGMKGSLKWECEVRSTDEALGSLVTNTDQGIAFQMTGYLFSKCKIRVPEGVRIDIVGQNGQVEIEDARSPVKVQVQNGDVKFEPAEGAKYKYELSVKNGAIKDKHLESFPDGLLVSISVNNGVVKID